MGLFLLITPWLLDDVTVQTAPMTAKSQCHDRPGSEGGRSSFNDYACVRGGVIGYQKSFIQRAACEFRSLLTSGVMTSELQNPATFSYV